MSPFEVACGWVGGEPAIPMTLPEIEPRGVLDSIQAVLLPALLRPPCLVQFSGGRDSSVILAIALGLARQLGLSEPIAITQRFSGIDESDEDEWQEAVVRHLGVTEWERLSLTDELDIVGPVAGPSLLSRGLVWPPLAHARWPLITPAQGGSIVTGEGGDEALRVGRAGTARALLTHPRRHARHGFAAAAAQLAPHPIRRIALRRDYNQSLTTPWLLPEPRARLLDELARQAASEPLDWRVAIRQHPWSRGVHVGMRTLDLFALEADVASFHPFLDAGVLANLGRTGGPFGFPSRTHAMRELFGSLLPDEVLARQTKARFNRAAFGIHSRGFARNWTGDGVPLDLVDPEALAATWAGPEPNAMSFGLLQAAWLASQTALTSQPGPVQK